MRMMRPGALVFLVVAAALIAFSSVACGPRSTLDFGAHRLTTNTWGAAPGEEFDCGIFLQRNNVFGWYWSRLDPRMNPGQSFVQPIYPNVRIGGSPLEKSNARQFPLKVSDLRNLSFDVSYEYLAAPTGAYNLSYEMFFSDTKKFGPNVVSKAEVMIWIHRTFTQPADAYQGEFSDGNNTYLLYSWVQTDGKKYYSFIMKGDPEFTASHVVDAKALLDQIHLDPEWYLFGVQFGSEIVNGTGRIRINRLNIDVNGTRL